MDKLILSELTNGLNTVWMLLHSLQTILFRQIAVMFALFAYVCFFNDSI